MCMLGIRKHKFTYRNLNDFDSQRRVATGNPVVFTLSPPECYMEIQNGYGIGGPRVTGPVRVGDPLTLIIYMRSKYGDNSLFWISLNEYKFDRIFFLFSRWL